MSYKQVKYSFAAGLRSKPMVMMVARKGIITKEQYKEITGDEYA